MRRADAYRIKQHLDKKKYLTDRFVAIVKPRSKGKATLVEKAMIAETVARLEARKAEIARMQAINE
jgi:hypothetical protein